MQLHAEILPGMLEAMWQTTVYQIGLLTFVIFPAEGALTAQLWEQSEEIKSHKGQSFSTYPQR